MIDTGIDTFCIAETRELCQTRLAEHATGENPLPEWTEWTE